MTIAEKRQKKPALRQLHGILLASCVVLILFIAAMALGRRVYCKENGRKDRRTTVTSYFCHQMHNFIILLFLLQPLRLQTRRLPPKTSIPYQPQRFSWRGTLPVTPTSSSSSTIWRWPVPGMTRTFSWRPVFQVCLLTQLLYVYFLYEIIDLSGGQMYDPLVGETLFYFVPLSNSFVSVSEGFLSWHSALQEPPSRLMRCFWNYRETRTPSGVLC